MDAVGEARLARGHDIRFDVAVRGQHREHARQVWRILAQHRPLGQIAADGHPWTAVAAHDEVRLAWPGSLQDDRAQFSPLAEDRESASLPRRARHGREHLCRRQLQPRRQVEPWPRDRRPPEAIRGNGTIRKQRGDEPELKADHELVVVGAERRHDALRRRTLPGRRRTSGPGKGRCRNRQGRSGERGGWTGGGGAHAQPDPCVNR